MSATETPNRPVHLFVYGTLMTRATGLLGAVQRKRLSLKGTSLGAATIAGRLVNLGTYPGLLEAEGPDDIVHGELFRLDQPDEVISWLDSYEGVSPTPTPEDDYARVLVPARLGDERVTTWVYLYRGSLAYAEPIPDGRWIG